jgi:hypothetical protein
MAVEWLAPLTANTKEWPPSLWASLPGSNGAARTAHSKEYVHYDLHAWLFKDDPLGIFAPTNPNVSCEG